VAFLAAYMSTISTQLNWGASYLVNDFYKRFIRPQATDKMLVRASQVTTILLMVVSLIVSRYIKSVEGAWGFIMEAGAGLGLVLILRWYWWRINAWSEIAATVAPFIVFGVITFLKYIATIECTMCETSEEIAAYLATKPYLHFPNSFFITVGITTAVWLLVTFITKPESDTTLTRFYNQVHPGGWWDRIAAQSALTHKKQNSAMLWLCWVAGIGFTYSALFLTGKIILHEWKDAALYAATGLASFALLWWSSKKGGVFGE
ncbi:MAG TPA: sodium:proline symporter, partial [Bacteroidia bacterium]|nr:sodium:proline symporter [Bacteroidia bacterium]